MLNNNQFKLISFIVIIFFPVSINSYDAFCTMFKYSKSNTSSNTFQRSNLNRLRSSHKVLSDLEIEKYNINSDKFSRSLSRIEKRALLEYTQDNEAIIKFINGQANFTEKNGIKLDDVVKNLDSIIDKYELGENIIVYRGTDQKYYKGLVIGDEFVSDNYYSTSLKRDIAEWYTSKKENSDPVLLEIFLPKKSKCFYVGEPLGGAYNAELIIAKGSKYRIVGMDSNLIQLEVIN